MHLPFNLNFCDFFFFLLVQNPFSSSFQFDNFSFRFEEMKAQKRNEDKTRSDALLLLLSFKSLNSHTQKGGIALTMDTFASKQEAKRGQIPSMHFKALTQSLFLAERNVSLHKVR